MLHAQPIAVLRLVLGVSHAPTTVCQADQPISRGGNLVALLFAGGGGWGGRPSREPKCPPPTHTHTLTAACMTSVPCCADRAGHHPGWRCWHAPVPPDQEARQACRAPGRQLPPDRHPSQQLRQQQRHKDLLPDAVQLSIPQQALVAGIREWRQLASEGGGAPSLSKQCRKCGCPVATALGAVDCQPP